MSKTDSIRQLEKEVINLKESPLYQERVQNTWIPVIGEGSYDAEIMFIGEAPGKNEALTGRPFCGASGKVLNELLEHIHLNREDVYITNIVKDRPTDNRDPKPEEIALYAPFLILQIEIIQPKIIATLGRFSMEFIMKHFGLEDSLASISNIHGSIFKVQMSYGEVYIIPLYHPAVAVYNRKQLNMLKKDFEILKTVLV